MKINRIHAVIGFLLIVVPLLGFTRGFKYGFSILSGAVILYFAMVSIHTEIKKKQKNRKYDSFVENKPRYATKSKSSLKTINTNTDVNNTTVPDEIPVDSHIALETPDTKPIVNE